jgi:hypothetical protein
MKVLTMYQIYHTLIHPLSFILPPRNKFFKLKRKMNLGAGGMTQAVECLMPA